MSGISVCCITGRIAGDSDACGDCDPCILGAGGVPEVVKALLKEKDQWRKTYDAAQARIDELEVALESAPEGYGAI